MDDINFSMTYVALKMFGKQLYANMSAAIAELVANGLDANAENVYVYMDIRDKNNATIAIYDDGDGMDYENMKQNYAIVGKNKRDKLEPQEARKKMGRKGIGKLAALYLSNKYYVITRREKSKNTRVWMLDVSNVEDENIPPKLQEIQYPFQKEHIFQKELNEKNKGTVILLENVLVKNFGQAAEDALEYKLANYFLTSNIEQNIKLCVLKNKNDKIEFKDVEKNIAFKNMAVIYSTDTTVFESIKYDRICLKDKNLKTKDQTYKTQREVLPIPEIVDTTFKDENGKSEKVSNYIQGDISIDGKSYEYRLEGWIGIHSTIEANDAKLNCDNFRKNMHYNPNQLRVYVRNKLATSNFLNYLGMTATFLNYIEGEISFDILDVEDLEDIATAGRDDFSVQDIRVKLLAQLSKGIVNKLVSQRQKIADKMKEYSLQIDQKIEEEEKKKIRSKFRNGAIKSKHVLEHLPADEQAAIEDDYVQFTRAANLSNATDLIFISHKFDCKVFGEFLIDILIKMYPPIKSRIIFSSSSDYGIPQGQDILDYLKTCFRADMHVIFLFSKSFYDSNVCLAEAGAAWSTNKKYSSFVIDIGFSDIDNPINRNQKGAVLVSMQEQDIKDFAKELIRIMKSVKVEQEFVEADIVEIINEEYEKYKDKLKIPQYVPHRKFQIVPKCSTCNHKMKIECSDGELKYTCECGNSQKADVTL